MKLKSYELIELLNCQRKFFFQKNYDAEKLPERVKRKKLILEALINEGIPESFIDNRDAVNLFLMKKYLLENNFAKKEFTNIVGKVDIEHNTFITPEEELVFIHISGHATRNISKYKIILSALNENKSRIVWLKVPNIRQKTNESNREFLERYFYNCKIVSKQLIIPLNELNSNNIILEKFICDMINKLMFSDDYSEFNLPNPSACSAVVETCEFFKECWGQEQDIEVYESPKIDIQNANKKQKELYSQFLSQYSKILKE